MGEPSLSIRENGRRIERIRVGKRTYGSSPTHAKWTDFMKKIDDKERRKKSGRTRGEDKGAGVGRSSKRDAQTAAAKPDQAVRPPLLGVAV